MAREEKKRCLLEKKGQTYTGYFVELLLQGFIITTLSFLLSSWEETRQSIVMYLSCTAEPILAIHFWTLRMNYSQSREQDNKEDQ